MQLIYTRTSILLFVLFCFSPLSAADYFWIGGSGDWSDISHWATASNGSITHSQAPTANDDVYFDFSSFNGPGQVVTLSTDIIFCRSMSWLTVSNNPTLQSGANVTLNVYGSLALNPNMTFNFGGRIVFTGNFPNNTISFATHTAAQDIVFSGMGGWTLNSGISVDSAFIFNEGTLNTDGQNIDCLYFHSTSTANRTLNLDNSVVTVQGATIDPFDGNVPNAVTQSMRLNANNFIMNPGNSLFIFTAPIVDIWLEGVGTINFNRVVLSNPVGNSHITPWASNGAGTDIPSMNYNEIHLFHQTQLSGSPVIGTLILQPEQRYLFEAGETFTFDIIDAIGNCGQTIVLETTDGGSPAIFTTDDDITVDFVTLKGINAQGAGSFTANEAIDLGNNDGWIINPRASVDFYWVGDGGNWNDPAHWSFTSGGPSSGCLPSALDDVFFDANSFSVNGQTVEINIENAYCRSMDWTGVTNNPILGGPMNNVMRLTGSLTLVAAMTQDFRGVFSFESGQVGNTITTAGQPFLFDLDFSGANGEWILQDEIYVDWSINLYSGVLRTNDQYVESNRFWSETSNTRELYLGNSYILLERHGNRAPLWEVTADNLTLEASNSTIEMLGNSTVLFRNEGMGTMDFNNVILNSFESRLFSLINPPSPVLSIDSLIFVQGGFISGSSRVNYWKMTAGETYEFVPAVTQSITELDANGDCESGLIYIRCNELGNSTNFVIMDNHVFNRLYVEGIHQMGNGNLNANNSIDNGNNLNWNFNNGTSRTLYWVGDEGDWSDITHWSLSSGGPGGECIPSPIDDVIFDINSFSSASPLITNIQGNNMYCRNITWEAGIGNTPTINANYIEIYGSMLIQSSIEWLIFSTEFKGTGSHTVTSGGNQLTTLIFAGGGIYTLLDDLKATGLRLNWGTFDTNNFDILAGRFAAEGMENMKLLQLRDSNLEFYEGSSQSVSTFQSVFPGLSIEPGNSQINFTAPSGGIRTEYELDFHNVAFLEPSGTADLFIVDANFNNVTFNGSGSIQGNLTTDTMLCAPGKAYIFEAGLTQNINEYWQIIGNNCTPIELSSSVIGAVAFVNMPESGNILADFIQMRDISASGGAEFLAGARSTDIANSNIGWIFESVPEFIDVGFLGPDLALCNGEMLEINAYSFSVGETYLWQNGSSNSSIVVDQTGFYSVAVTFLSNCVIRDTIEVVAPQDFNVDLADDPELCGGESIVFDADVGIDGATYTWQDGSTDPDFTTNTAGEYSVIIAIGNCSVTDTTQVSTNVFPALDLGPDLNVCPDEDFTLTANVPADTYSWQNGTTMDSFTGNQDGIYWLEAANGTCASRDSLTVTYVEYPIVNLGVDTLLCDQTDFLLSVDIPSATYAWSDASTNNSLNTTASGTYWLEATLNGCSTRDSIMLTFQDNPSIELDDQVFGCQGEFVELSSPVLADAYSWSNGDMGENFSTNTAGMYFLDATFGSCVVSEEFEVVISDFPIVQSLGIDTMLCEGTTYTLNASADMGTITWQDGSTNPNFLVSTAGTYSFIADNQGCTTEESIDISYTDDPELDIDNSYAVCDGTVFNLSSSVVADSYLWSNGDIGPAFTTNTAGNYSLEATFGMCTVTADFVVNFLSTPTLDLGVDQTACVGDQILLDAGMVGVWQDNSTASTFVTTKSGLYFVTVSNDDCSSTDSVLVDFLPLPAFDLGPDLSGCEGDSITLQAPTDLDLLSWEDGSIDLQRSITTGGEYWLEMEGSNGCINRDSITLNFSTQPFLELGVDTTVCDLFPYQVVASIGEGDFSWFDGSTANSLLVENTGLVTASIDNNGCITTDDVRIEFKKCKAFQAYIPNIFSPNNDGLNDIFLPHFDPSVTIFDYHMRIFDRWGSQVFESDDPLIGWRGFVRSQLAPAAVYVYFIEITYSDDFRTNTEILKGDVGLVR